MEKTKRLIFILLMLPVIANAQLTSMIDSSAAELMDFTNLLANQSNIATATKLNKTYFDSKIGTYVQNMVTRFQASGYNSIDWDSIEDASEAAMTSLSGSVIQLPQGTITETNITLQPGSWVIGHGAGTIIDLASVDVSFNKSNADTLENFILDGIKFINSSATRQAASRWLSFEKVKRLIVKNCQFIGIMDRAIMVNLAEEVYIINNYFDIDSVGSPGACIEGSMDATLFQQDGTGYNKKLVVMGNICQKAKQFLIWNNDFNFESRHSEAIVVGNRIKGAGNSTQAIGLANMSEAIVAANSVKDFAVLCDVETPDGAIVACNTFEAQTTTLNDAAIRVANSIETSGEGYDFLATRMRNVIVADNYLVGPSLGSGPGDGTQGVLLAGSVTTYESLDAAANTSAEFIVGNFSSSVADFYNHTWMVHNHTRSLHAIVTDYKVGGATDSLYAYVASQAAGDSITLHKLLSDNMNFIVNGNIIKGFEWGVELYRVMNVIISNNIIHDGIGPAINFAGAATNVVISDNVCFDDSAAFGSGSQTHLVNIPFSGQTVYLANNIHRGNGNYVNVGVSDQNTIYLDGIPITRTVIAKSNLIEAAASLFLRKADPAIIFQDTESSATEQVWKLYADNNLFNLVLASDALVNDEAVLAITRNGTDGETFQILNSLVGIGDGSPKAVLTIKDAIPTFSIYDSDNEKTHAAFANIDSSAINMQFVANIPKLDFESDDGKNFHFTVFADTLIAVHGTDTLRIIPSR